MSSPESHNRQRLRPWLEAKINSGQFPGLEWMDRNLAIFKIPWKHGGKQDWSESDSLIFKEWAVHTGRFRDGIDQPDWPSWKTRLRCALNKLPDIQEIKDMSNLDGNSPFRVYRFIPKGSVRKIEEKSTLNLSNDGISEPCEDVQLLTHQHTSQKVDYTHQFTANIPKTVTENISEDNDMDVPRISSLGSDLGNIDVKDLIPLGSQAAQNGPSHEQMDTSNNLVVDEATYPTDTHTGAPSVHRSCLASIERQILDSDLQQLLLELSRSPTEPDVHEMIVKLKYRHNEVAGHHVRNLSGCRLFYGPMVDTIEPQFQDEMYGRADLEKLQFPLCDELIEKQQQIDLTSQLLNVLDRGLILETVNGDIYATRKCRLVIFVSQPDSQSSQPIKLLRNNPRVKVFDYNSYFLPTLDRARRGECLPPSAEVLIGFGQDWKTEKEPYNNLLISATIFHARAYHQLSQIHPELFVSNSDDYDRYLDTFK